MTGTNLDKMRGYSLAEVVLAVGLAAVIVLALIGLSLTALRGNRKSVDLTLAESVANNLLSEQIYQAQANSSAPLWTHNDALNPLAQSKTTVGNQEYSMALYVTDSVAVPNLKRCRLRLAWWAGDARQGYGQLFTEAVRIVALP